MGRQGVVVNFRLDTVEARLLGLECHVAELQLVFRDFPFLKVLDVFSDKNNAFHARGGLPLVQLVCGPRIVWQCSAHAPSGRPADSVAGSHHGERACADRRAERAEGLVWRDETISVCNAGQVANLEYPPLLEIIKANVC